LKIAVGKKFLKFLFFASARAALGKIEENEGFSRELI